MTMFRRVFSTHFDEQGKDADRSGSVGPRPDIPPAPPSAPPEYKPHGKLPLTELGQTLPKEKANPAATPDPSPTDPVPDLSARAAEIHSQMLQRGASQPPRAASAEDTDEADAAPATPPRRSGRARTRLLGFDGGAVAADPIAAAKTGATAVARTNPAGWVAIIKGPGQGQHFAIFGGVSMVGRGEDQGIRLDFGDQTISRQNHAALAYDAEDNKFYLGHGGKSNIIKLNGRPVLSTEEIFHGDTFRIGETVLRFVALCGPDFQWGGAADV